MFSSFFRKTLPLMQRNTLARLGQVSKRIDLYAEANPFKFQLGICIVKTAVADGFAQVVVEKKDFDLRRNLVFISFGACYLGGVQYCIYYHAYRHLFPDIVRFGKLPFKKKLRDTAGLRTLATVVTFDNLIPSPFLYYPTFYIFKEIIQYPTNEVPSASTIVSGAVSKYKRNAKNDLIAMWSVYVPAGLIIQAMPMHLKLPVTHAISLGWVVCLSFMRGAANSNDGDDDHVVSSPDVPL